MKWVPHLALRNPDPDPEVRGQAIFWLSHVDLEEAVDAQASSEILRHARMCRGTSIAECLLGVIRR